MRLLPLILVIANLLFRGVAVPHVHVHDDAGEHAGRPHVHLANHSHPHDHGHGRRHVHHDNESEHASPSSTPTPGHDDDAVYGPDDTLIVNSAGWPKVTPAIGHRLAIAPRHGSLPPSNAAPRPGLVRPPGNGAVLISTLLPHVLRV